MKKNERSKMTFGELFLRELSQKDAKALRRAIVAETGVVPSTLWRWARDLTPTMPSQNIIRRLLHEMFGIDTTTDTLFPNNK